MAPERLWRLERNDRRVVCATGEASALFARTDDGMVGAHRHPLWKLVLPLGNRPVEVHGEAGRFEAPAVVVPPQWWHACVVPGGVARISLDVQVLAMREGPVVLTARERRRLLDALGMGGDLSGDPDLAALRAEAVALLGARAHLDFRVARALDQLGEASSLAELAGGVGLSAPRLRALVRTELGVPLARLRRWERLRRAVIALPGGSVADAAAGADFADQAHLARTVRELAGSTPSSLLI
ncbi:helix-turn-helix domain-containing protein [Nocardia neocaledoniensis]|uniref:helix-turn-helix domain-containing protein n=1 Tax=Nocardia neocaledoniensis TaxID=236511 RepID=UPI002453C18E|nr:helix-turn-helix domain-containing protein [Nocardia neocaledoniensis]